MDFEVKGHSGCTIDIVREGGRLIVEKGTENPDYVDRLYRQALKQKAALFSKLQFIHVPEIFEIRRTEKGLVIRMEYIYSKSFIDYFEESGFEQVNYFIKAIILFLESEIDQSEMAEVPSTVIWNKFNDVKKKILNNPIIVDSQRGYGEMLSEVESRYMALPPVLEMPVGVCHGDLTLSNILFTGNNFYLIDFLDSFIESPLLDIVKIRQDTAHKWSPLMFTGHYDRTRFDIIVRKIDEDLDKEFSRYEWYRRLYEPFQLMNLLRVLQYAKEQKTAEYLYAEISKILKKDEK